MSDLVDEQPHFPPPRPPAPTDSVVEAWFLETFHNVPLSTELFNRFAAAKERLKGLLRSAGE